jgi:hypothetical protein
VKNTAIFAVYPTHAQAESALNALKAKGFTPSDISIVAPRVPLAEPVALELGAVSAEPAAAEASGPGPAIGVAIGWLTSLGAIAVSGAMLLAAGPIMATLKGVSDALLGVADALVGFGIPAEEAKKYADRVHAGAVLLSVHAEDEESISHGREILVQTGAEDISSMYRRQAFP